MTMRKKLKKKKDPHYVSNAEVAYLDITTILYVHKY